MKYILFHTMLSHFDESLHKSIKNLASKDGVVNLVEFINQNFSSSEFGRNTVMAIGPGFSYETLNDVKGKFLNDLPSQRQYPQFYTNIVKCPGCGRALIETENDGLICEGGCYSSEYRLWEALQKRGEQRKALQERKKEI